jgi:hypothetical protein
MIPKGPASQAAFDPSLADAIVYSDHQLLRRLIVGAGLFWSTAFLVIGLQSELQMYADGSLFSYSVAVQDGWAFHWHNISGRLFVYVFAHVPAEIYVEVARDARGGIVIYGFLFFVAPLLGLIATFVLDRSKGRIIFTYACVSTACLCPLVFGFPTEMWLAHALFWPALSVCHYARNGIAGSASVFATLLALVFTHGAALILAIVVLSTLLLRGMRDRAVLRTIGVFLVVMSIWALVKVIFPPDDYDAPVLVRAELHFFDVTIFRSRLLLLVLGALTAYGIAFLVLRRLAPTRVNIYAVFIVGVALAVYWLWFDRSLHADDRYYLRTVLLIGTIALSVPAAAYALRADGRLKLLGTSLTRLMASLTSDVIARATAGAIALAMLIHAAETVKFVRVWTDYKAAIRTLAVGTAADPWLGDPHFVSSDRVGPNLNRVSWSSTTHFLSVLVAPKFAPVRLVVDPEANYFWLSCQTATANQLADRAIPAETRRLVRIHACLHR